CKRPPLLWNDSGMTLCQAALLERVVVGGRRLAGRAGRRSGGDRDAGGAPCYPRVLDRTGRPTAWGCSAGSRLVLPTRVAAATAAPGVCPSMLPRVIPWPAAPGGSPSTPTVWRPPVLPSRPSPRPRLPRAARGAVPLAQAAL